MIEIIRGIFAVLFTFSFAIFIHELGHFMFAKWFGVKVETFSIGFGKKIFKFRRGETEYCLSLIPLGGYVKMAGIYSKEMEQIIDGDKVVDKEEKLENEIAAAELQAPAPVDKKSLGKGIIEEVDALRSKPYWQKILIFSAGCINNFLTAAVTFFLLIWIGHYDSAKPEAVIGEIEYIAPTESPLQINDKIVAVGKGDENPVKDITDYYIALDKSLSANAKTKTPLELSVLRGGTTMSITLPLTAPGLEPLPEGKIVKIGETAVSSEKETIQALSKVLSLGTTTPISVVVDGGDTHVKTVEVPPIVASGTLWPSLAYDFQTSPILDFLLPNLPAERAGLKDGDVVLAIDGTPVMTAKQATTIVRKNPGKTVDFTVLRTENEKETTITKQVAVRADPEFPERGQIGVQFAPGKKTEFVQEPFFSAIQTGFSQAWIRTKMYPGLLKDLFFSSSFTTIRENVSGPIDIGRSIFSVAKADITRFAFFFAAFNIALCVMNLLPLPVLDGGHIIFATAEAIIRRPLPAKVMMGVYNLFTIFLLTMALLVTFNDVIKNLWRLPFGK